MRVVLLEDDDRRVAAMRERLADRFPQFELVVTDNAKDCIAAIADSFDRILLVSLDHDLVLLPSKNGGSIDPGTGREVADDLAGRTPSFPVIVHTSNSIAGDGMEFRLVEGGWPVERVAPYGDLDWIDEVWFKAARRLLVAAPVYSK
ncbi:MAG: cyclic-phosphate processing receiver domain-containing protein [Pirellulales bacterium]